ncbi:lia operon protein LiaI [Halolactibacillus alkaliphilus]|nr:lia operon protein LiaI [Halolactibacillus alkaliphilus]
MMRTLILLVMAFIFGAIVLSMLGPLIAFVLTIGLLYYGVRRFLLADNALEKIGFGIVALIGLSLSLSNSPALIGLGAVVLLYMTLKASQKTKTKTKNYDWQTEY